MASEVRQLKIVLGEEKGEVAIPQKLKITASQNSPWRSLGGLVRVRWLSRLTLGFSSGQGHDLVVCEFEPCMGLWADSAEPVWDSLSVSVSVSVSLPLQCALFLSLKINKLKKKKKKNFPLTPAPQNKQMLHVYPQTPASQPHHPDPCTLCLCLL